ncbi:MAG: hypothetical protein ACKVOE_01425 [Rickettsiales bacterium]
MGTEPSTEMPSGEDYDAVQQSLQKAFKVADESFAKHFADWWSAMGTDAMNKQLSGEIDIPDSRFSRRRLVNALGESRKRLEARMQKVSNQNAFIEECYDSIEAEMEELFFVTNNRAEAKMVQDYFLRFLAAASGELELSGHMEKEVAEYCQAFKEYYDIGFESYDDLREIVHEVSGGTTHSIVALAMSQHASDESSKRGISKLPKLSEQSQPARDMIKAMTVPAYNALLASEYGLSYEPNQVFHYSTPWICYQARELSGAQYELNLPRRFSRSQQQTNAIEGVKLERELMRHVSELIAKEGNIFGLIDASVMFNHKRAEANQVPEGFPDMLHEACARAEHIAAEQFKEIYNSHIQRWASLPAAKSRELGKNAWPLLDTWDMDNGVARDIGHYLTEAVINASSPLRVARRAEQIVDEMAADVMLGCVSPVQFRYAEQYLKTLRRELGSQLHDVGQFQAEAFAPLRQLEEKCRYAYESAEVLREWVLDSTDHKFDRLMQEQYLKHALKTGQAIHQLNPNEWADTIMPKTAKSYRKLLKNSGFYQRGKDHVLLPVIVRHARRVVDAELGAAPTSEAGASNEEITDFETRYWERTRALVQEALSAMPDRDALTGNSHRRYPFSAEDMHEAITDLDGKAALLTHRGTRH